MPLRCALDSVATIGRRPHLSPCPSTRPPLILSVEVQREPCHASISHKVPSTSSSSVRCPSVPARLAHSERAQQMSSEVLCIQQGSLYPALHRLERRGWIAAR